MAKTIHSTGIREKQRFYNRAVVLGIDLATFNPDNIDFSGKTHKSSFKKRSQYIKELHNYKFNFKNRDEDYFLNFPNIESVTFERK